MARPAMSQELINTNKISIINAAMDMLRKDGLSSVSARSLGASVDMNSALIYRYFKDIDEVVLFACVHSLQDYSRNMISASREIETSEESYDDYSLYMLSWEIFCKHAFARPDEFNMLFFSRHSSKLYDVIKQYSELFPRRGKEKDDIILRGMFRTSDLKKRNLALLTPVLESKKSDDEIILINEMTIAFFYTLISQMLNHPDSASAEEQTKRMLSACEYLTRV